MQEFRTKKKLTVFIQANCQSHALRHIFQKVNRLNDKYEIMDVKPVHLWKDEDKEEIIEKISQCDIFLHQPIDKRNFGFYASDNLLTMLKSGAKSVSFPNLYFTGYHPQAFYLKDENGKKVDGPFDYHDRNIVEFFKQGLSTEEILEKIQDESFYSQEDIKANIDQSLKALREREQYTDIKVSDYIESNMIGNKLFHIFNHPSNEMIFVLFDKILERIGEEFLSSQEIQSFPREMLGKIQFMMYSSLQKYFGFHDQHKILLLQKEYSVEEMIEEYYTFYKDSSVLINIIDKKGEKMINKKKNDNRFIVLSPPRTGSTMVRMILNNLDTIKCHGEVFGINRVLGVSTKVDISYSIEDLFQLRNADMKKFLNVLEFNDKSKYVGIKVLYDQLLKSPELIKYIQNNNIKIIHLWRNDLEARHYSEVTLKIKARNKHVAEKKVIAHKSTASMIFNEAKNLIFWGNLYQDIFRKNPILNISYEDFLMDEKTRIDVLEFLNQDNNLIENLEIPQKRFSFDKKDIEIIFENKEEESRKFKLLADELPTKNF